MAKRHKYIHTWFMLQVLIYNVPCGMYITFGPETCDVRQPIYNVLGRTSMICSTLSKDRKMKIHMYFCVSSKQHICGKINFSIIHEFIVNYIPSSSIVLTMRGWSHCVLCMRWLRSNETVKLCMGRHSHVLKTKSTQCPWSCWWCRFEFRCQG